MAVGLALVIGLVIAACGTTIVPRAPQVLTVPGMVGTDMQLEIVDETGELVDARALSGEALRAVAMPLEGLIAAQAGSTPNEARIVWLSFACETSGRLTISNPNKVTITPSPRATGCDAIGNHRAVDLVFRVPVNPAALQVELQGFPQEKG
jgi:hypothetical protein